MQELTYEFEAHGLTCRVYRDESPLDPRKEYDHAGTLVTWHKRYKLGDVQPSQQPIDWERENLTDDIVWFRVYMYDHSGITINTTGFNCPWDSGQLGFIFAPKELDGMTVEQIEDLLRAEIAEYSAYLEGEVYGYEVLNSAGESIDSCWGFYGTLVAMEAAKDSARMLASKDVSGGDLVPYLADGC